MSLTTWLAQLRFGSRRRLAGQVRSPGGRQRSAARRCSVEQLEDRMLLSFTPIVPCSDPRGCPDLIVDQQSMSDWQVKTQSFSSGSCAVVEGETQAGKRRLLRFSSATPNMGSGSLIVGDPNLHPEWFDFGNCHGHPHFKQYADYRLWRPADYTNWRALRDDPANNDIVSRDLINTLPAASQPVEGRKQGYCVIDNSGPYSFPGVTADPKTYSSCSNQGISVGWADRYNLRLDGQWIDVTGVAAGTYVLEVEVNAERFFQETGYSNNSAAVTVQVTQQKGGKSASAAAISVEALRKKRHESTAPPANLSAITQQPGYILKH